MTSHEPIKHLIGQMPDIAAATIHNAGCLDWVGMSGIHLPLQLEGVEGNPRVSASADVYVDLADPVAKGIHMSRLYLHLDAFARHSRLRVASLTELLDTLHDSHSGLSERAAVVLRFDYLREQDALKSDNSGWRAYPVTLAGRRDASGVTLELGLTVQYSSTCPCSAALARQLIVRKFSEDFAEHGAVAPEDVANWLASEQGILATPHSQRSHATLKVRLAPGTGEASLPLDTLIDAAEQALQTPVQAAVKREDEQEFARLNGQNLMFCEDAARRVRAALEHSAAAADYAIRVEHFESLHAHDAVSVVVKGVPNGYRADLL